MKLLSEYFEKYIKEEFEPYKGSGVSEITIKNMYSVLNLIKECDEDMESSDKAYVLKFWEFLKAKGHSISSTVPKRMTTLKGFYKFLVREGHRSVNPCDQVRKSIFQEKYGTNKGLDKNDLKKLENAELKGAQRRERDLFMFRVHTGLSWQESRDFHKDWITSRNGYKMIISNRGKTGIEFRIPVTDKVQEYLDKLLLKDGTLPVTSNVNQNEILHRIEKKLGLQSLHTHLSRHTTGSMYKSSGVPLDLIKVIMGHGSIITTDKRYGEASDEYLTKKVRNLVKEEI